MKTLIIIILYLIVGAFAGKVISILANLAGGLGVMLGSLGRPNELTGARKGIALLLCTLFQAYVFLSWTVFVISYTILITRNQPVVRWLVWIAAFFASEGPLIVSASTSTREEKENPELKNTVPTLALNMNCLFDSLCFFLFVFIPVLMLYGWPWVPYVRVAIQP